MIKYLNYILNRFKSSKYVRKGKCSKCGACCRNILLYTERGIAVTSEEQFEKIKEFDKHFKNFYISGKNESGKLLFTCREIDENNRCRMYLFRGLVCRTYPKPDSYFLANGGELLDGCGYYFEPDKSFKSYLKMS